MNDFEFDTLLPSPQKTYSRKGLSTSNDKRQRREQDESPTEKLTSRTEAGQVPSKRTQVPGKPKNLKPTSIHSKAPGHSKAPVPPKRPKKRRSSPNRPKQQQEEDEQAQEQEQGQEHEEQEPEQTRQAQAQAESLPTPTITAPTVVLVVPINTIKSRTTASTSVGDTPITARATTSTDNTTNTALPNKTSAPLVPEDYGSDHNDDDGSCEIIKITNSETTHTDLAESSKKSMLSTPTVAPTTAPTSTESSADVLGLSTASGDTDAGYHSDNCIEIDLVETGTGRSDEPVDEQPANNVIEQNSSNSKKQTRRKRSEPLPPEKPPTRTTSRKHAIDAVKQGVKDAQELCRSRAPNRTTQDKEKDRQAKQEAKERKSQKRNAPNEENATEQPLPDLSKKKRLSTIDYARLLNAGFDRVATAMKPQDVATATAAAVAESMQPVIDKLNASSDATADTANALREQTKMLQELISMMRQDRPSKNNT